MHGAPDKIDCSKRSQDHAIDLQDGCFQVTSCVVRELGCRSRCSFDVQTKLTERVGLRVGEFGKENRQWLQQDDQTISC